MEPEEEIPPDVIVLHEAIPAGRYLVPSAVARRLGLQMKGVRWLADVGRLGVIITPFGRLYTEKHVERYLRRRAELWPQAKGNRRHRPSPS